MSRLVLAIFIAAFLAQPAAGLPTLEGALAANHCGAGREPEICDQIKEAFCREYDNSDAKCVDAAGKKIEKNSALAMPKGCDPAASFAYGANKLDEWIKQCGLGQERMNRCCVESSEGMSACLKEIGASVDLVDPGGGDKMKMLCDKAGVDMDAVAKANAAVAGTCISRGYIWSTGCNDTLPEIKKLDVAPSYTTEIRGFNSCTPLSATEIKKQVASLLEESKVAKDCSGKVTNPDDPDKPIADNPPGTTTPETPNNPQQPDAGGGGGMEALSAVMPMLADMMKGQGEEDKTEDKIKEIQFENTECEEGDAKCAAQKVADLAPNTPEASRLTASATPSFNPADLPNVNGAFGDVGKAADPAGPGAVVPNGGGSMPGGGGGGGGGAMPGGPRAQSAGANTDVMHGFQGGGGYSAMNAAMTMTPTSTGGFRGYGSGSDSQGVDLSQFLPNGAKDPNKKLAGLRDPKVTDIQGKDVNMFNRVSERIQSRCAQGLLRDCIP